MFQKNVKIISPNGLHTRPAAKFVKSAKKFKSEIIITTNNNSANAKSLFNLQTLNLTKGTVITITANGTDEKDAVKYLTKILMELK
ncbi:HPr family phosphocarrier protein [Buchnera aphidicola]|uniref:Phosphocarrier protein HPr n=1 Tax=Buchnera aphidicola (Therioaphis trifolii) TaxID=1241884 RepID=A0A4D6YAY1_9GAMM|nr:HPr family phosphocarrier protein [Buchnera aphidicola]QCI27057.1 HPr family phosphocarrier protein [Buchnera aphidicola (Therioaphis trifolii)]